MNQILENNNINIILEQKQNTNNNLEFSDVSGILSDDKIIVSEKFDTIPKTFYLIFNSKYRDLYLYPTQSTFQVKFSPSGDNYFYQSIYDENKTLIIREKSVFYGEDTGNSVNEVLDNILSINVITLQVPTTVQYIGGILPSNYPNLIGSNPPSKGIISNIFQLPYSFLVIPELRSPYISSNTLVRNAFAKLVMGNGASNYLPTLPNLFMKLRKTTPTEFFTYTPVLHGKLDKMTLNLVNPNGLPLNFNIDKIFVNYFSVGTPLYNGYCGNLQNTTQVYVDQLNYEYTKYCREFYSGSLDSTKQCNYLNSIPVLNADVLYFYTMIPTEDQIIYFEPQINTVLEYSAPYYYKVSFNYQMTLDDGSQKIVDINIKNILNTFSISEQDFIQNYLFILNAQNYYNPNSLFYCKIVTINSDYSFTVVPLNSSELYNLYTGKINFKSGFAKKNLRGANSNDPQSLFFENGIYVVYVNPSPDPNNNVIDPFTINFPYDKLPFYLKGNTEFSKDLIFFIQDKLQISYTFKVVTTVKDTKKLKSYINDSGNN